MCGVAMQVGHTRKELHMRDTSVPGHRSIFQNVTDQELEDGRMEYAKLAARHACA